MEHNCAIEMRGITKRFGQVVANDSIDLTINKGEILALLGENGSGKTTLMNMLSGIYQPDEGEIFKEGERIFIRSPREAFEYGIGMIHQHYKLIEVFTAAQNIILGLDEGKMDLRKTNERVAEICGRYGFEIDLSKKVYDMSVSQKQTIEIVKMLYRGADILILDEPTAVLTPQETEKLFKVLKNMKADGKAIVIITHKLHEVMDVSDKVAVLRKGQYIGTVNTSETNPQALTDMMVGHAVTLNIDRPKYDRPKKKLIVENLTCIDAEGIKKLDSVSFYANTGEILGVAGISGSGQKELLEAMTGLYPVAEGSIRFIDSDDNEVELVGLTPKKIRATGVGMAFVPEDRLGMGLVGSMGMTGNMMLRSWKNGKGALLKKKEPEDLANRVWKELEVVTPGVNYPVRRLSGGNVQKVLVGREIAIEPAVLLTAYAVRGLDINTSYTIYNLLTEQKMKGVAVLYVGEDLDVLIELCDRILVLCDGRVSGIVDGRTATKEEIGLMMTHIGNKEAADE